VGLIFSSLWNGFLDLYKFSYIIFSNAIGPLIALYLVFTEESAIQNSETPIWLLVFGGVGISVGLWCMGKRVMETIGTDLTNITPTT
jgi:sodium-dependent phosphate transporter